MKHTKPHGVLVQHGAQVTESSLGRLWTHWKRGGFGIVSANRGERTPDENAKWYAKLKAEVRADGYGFIPLMGFWNETDTRTGKITKQKEPSLLVPARHLDHFQAIESVQPVQEVGWFHPGLLSTPTEALRESLMAWGRLDRSLPQEAVIYARPDLPDDEKQAEIQFIDPVSEQIKFKLSSFNPGKVADIYSSLRRSLGKQHARTFVFEGWRFVPPPETQVEALRRRHEGELRFVSG